VPLGKVGNLSLTALRSYGAAGATTVFATVTIPLGELTSGTVTFDRTRDSATGATSENRTLVMQKSLPLGDGYGYRVQRRNAVLPRLRSYDRNQVSIDHNDLPFDAILDRLRLDAVPYLRSGVLLEFPVHRVRAATLHVLLEDGTPLPSGALARFEGKDKQFP